jgi:hypothetical protein
MSELEDRRRRFELLYGEHHRAVLGYLMRRTESPEDAADVIADVFRPPGGGSTTFRPESRRVCGCSAWRAARSPTTTEASGADRRSAIGCAPIWH